jgi:hypothetical protein
MGDFYDCFFILRQILTHGVHVVPQVCFTIGIDTEEQTLKPARPRGKAVYEYLPFCRNAASVIVASRKLTPAEKARLLYLLALQMLNEFAYFERPVRPRRARLAAYGLRLLRPLHRLFGVNVPLPPPALRLPPDPAGVCYVYIPPQELESAEGLQRQLAEARRHRDEKEQVIRGLEPAVRHERLRIRPAARALRALSRAARWLNRADVPPPPPPAPAGPSDNRDRDELEELRRQLGMLLLEVEEKHARILALMAELEDCRKWAG